MYTLHAAYDRSEEEESFEYLNIQIEGKWLDEILEELYPGYHYKGLVPTLLPFLNDEEEKKLVWERILPEEGEKTICPILMCPDDCDFSCTIIVAEIENWGDTICWLRMGIDVTPSLQRSEQIGSKVNWFSKIGTLEFETAAYTELLEIFSRLS